MSRRASGTAPAAWLLLAGTLLHCTTPSAGDGYHGMGAHIEPFDTSILPAHLGLILASSSVAGGLLLATLGTLIWRRRIRTSLLLVVMMWCAQTLVGLLVWHLTYTSMREALSHQVETLLIARTNEVALVVKSTMDTGGRMNDALVEMHNNRLISLNASYPHSINISHAMWMAWRDNPAISYVYYGNRHGYGFGISPLNKRLMIVAPPSEYLKSPNESMFGPEFSCIGVDEDEGRCGEPDACASPESAARCQRACRVMSRGNCAGANLSAPGRGVLVRFKDAENWQDFDDSIDFRAVTYSPHLRPWYELGLRDNNTWTQMYIFTGGTDIGTSVVHGIRDPDRPDEFLGVVAVDYAIATLSITLRNLTPSDAATVLLLNMHGNILAGNVDKALLSRYTGEDEFGQPQYELSVASESTSEAVRAPVLAILSRFGSLPAALDHAEVLLLHEGRTIIAVRRAVIRGGLKTLVVITMPYSEVLQKGDDASLQALILTVVISLVCSLLVAGLVLMLMRPLHTLIGSVYDVSHMQLTGAEALALDTSPLVEVGIMREAMSVLLTNMKEYKSFMPEAIFSKSAPSPRAREEAPGRVTGYAAIVFTDIVGSTRLWEGTYEGMLSALQVHHEVIRDSIALWNGYEVKTIGDSFMVAFETALEGMHFGISVQESLGCVDWPESLRAVSPDGIVLRIGCNYGAVAVEHNAVAGRSDYLGPTVNRAARLEAVCAPGAVSVSDEVLLIVAPTLSEAVTVRPIGSIALKGISGAVAVSMVFPRSLSDDCTVRTRNPLAGLPFEQDCPPSPCSTASENSADVVSQCGTRGGMTPRNRTRCGDRNLLRFTDMLEAVPSATVGYVEGLVTYDEAHDVTQQVNASLLRAVTHVEITGGKILTVAGSATLVGWNAMKQCAAHVESSFRFVGLLTRNHTESLRCGITTGRILRGQVGMRGQRYITAVGPTTRQCTQLHCIAEQLGATALYASDDPGTTALLSSKGYLRPVAELPGDGVPVVLYEMHCARLNVWCYDKLLSLFADARNFTPPAESIVAGEDPRCAACWSAEYREAYEQCNVDKLTHLAAVDPVVFQVVCRMQVSIWGRRVGLAAQQVGGGGGGAGGPVAGELTSVHSCVSVKGV